jgi:micrococcal nuclease
MGLIRLLFGIARRQRHPAPPPTLPQRPAPRTQPRQTQPRPAVPAPAPAPPVAGEVLRGRCWVIDGDTIVIGRTRIRLAGIDAPELDHPWGRKSKWALVALCKGRVVTATVTGELSYDRVVARCVLPDGRDLAAELVRIGLALDWPKYSGGRYLHLEPPDARRRLWRAAQRQAGHYRGG